QNPDLFVLLEHQQGIPVDKSVSRQFPNRLEHDPSDLGRAFQLAADSSKMPLGLLYHNPDAQCYEDLSSQGVAMTPEQRLAGFNAVLDRITV
ncbi:MAG: 2-oxoglutarate oxidoreductase, partial [Candidatus Thiodiazotropha sp. (ex Lucinoma borealis)]|nr:2-oxoglutarate oxidoreductase [Candidatus Thiodiazotropha sp. (ex Lucinoma borealis)]